MIFLLYHQLHYIDGINGHKPECYRNPNCFPKTAIQSEPRWH